MDDMDAEAEELGGRRSFFAKDYARYGWAKLMRSGLGGHETLALYSEAIAKMPENPGIPGQFRSPRHIIDFMVAILDPKKWETILDPACGTAGFLISAYKHILRANTSSSKWMKTQSPGLATFAWQRGYGAFSVGPSDLDALRHYIDTQENHHRTRTFQEEYRAFLTKYGIEYDERYVWD
jgi:hypothetical protein